MPSPQAWQQNAVSTRVISRVGDQWNMSSSGSNAEPCKEGLFPMEEKINAPQIPEELRGLFGDPPLWEGDDPKLYHSLLAAVIRERKPETFTDWLAVHDLVTALWEELRLRRASAGIIRAGMLPALMDFSKAIFWHDHPSPPLKMPSVAALQYFSEDLDERNEFKSLLAQYGFTEVEIQARSAQMNSDAVRMLESMIAARERKRRKLRKEDRQSARRRRGNKENPVED